VIRFRRFFRALGGTVLTGESRHESVAARDAHVSGGTERGMREGYRRLDDHLLKEES
jgi:hypothetical protein